MLSIIYHVYTSFLRYLFKSGLLFFTVFTIFQFFCGLVPSVAHLERNDGETIKECEWGWIACQTGQRRSCGEQNRERQRREWKTRSKPAGSATGLPVQNCWTCLVAPLSFVARRTERLFFTRFPPVFFISPKMPARNRSGDGEIREGWRGRWEEERRGVMDESERWEATRRPSSVCEFLLEPTRPRRTSSPSYKRRTRVCPCEDQARNVAAKKQNEPTASHLKHILHITFAGKIWFEGCQSLIDALIESWQPYRSIINSLTISIYSENLNLSQK